LQESVACAAFSCDLEFPFRRVLHSLRAGLSLRGEGDGDAAGRGPGGAIPGGAGENHRHGHPWVRLASEIDWSFLEGRFGSVYRPGPGQPPLPARLIAGLFILRYMHSLSHDALCARWMENAYYQLFCGEAVFRHELPFDRSPLTRWRQRLGEEQLAALIQASLAAAQTTGLRTHPRLLQMIPAKIIDIRY
jgi:hypothetical protein